MQFPVVLLWIRKWFCCHKTTIIKLRHGAVGRVGVYYRAVLRREMGGVTKSRNMFRLTSPLGGLVAGAMWPTRASNGRRALPESCQHPPCAGERPVTVDSMPWRERAL